MIVQDLDPVVTITFVPPDSPPGLHGCGVCARETYVMLTLADATPCCRWCFRRARAARPAQAKRPVAP